MVSPLRKKAQKLRALRRGIKAGIYDLDRGDFDEVDESDLDAYLEGLAVRSNKSTR